MSLKRVYGCPVPLLLNNGLEGEYVELMQSLEVRFSGKVHTFCPHGPVLVPAEDHPDSSSLAALYSLWIKSGEPTVIRMADGVLQSRFVVFSSRGSLEFPQPFKFFQDGTLAVVYGCGSEKTAVREEFLDRVESMVYASCRPASTCDVEGAETFIRSRFKQDFPALAYHNPLHIQDVLDSAIRIAEVEGVSQNDTLLLRFAALFHDAGFMFSMERHEERGADLAAGVLPVFGFSPESVEVIRSMILATRVPQRPKTLLEKILCDADLDYLGRSDFYETGGLLYDELRTAGVVNDMLSWNRLQLRFLMNHEYHTGLSKMVREPEKQKRIREIAKLIGERD